MNKHSQTVGVYVMCTSVASYFKSVWLFMNPQVYSPECLCPFNSVQNIQPSASLDFSELDSALQQQERIMTVSHALASEASRKSKLVAG